MTGQVLSGDEVLALADLGVDDRDAVGLGPTPDPAGEPSGHAHEMGVVQVSIAVVVPAPPPDPEPPGAEPQGEVGIEDDSVHAVVAAGQKIAIAFAELVTHGVTVRRDSLTTHEMTAPKGPPIPSLSRERA